MDFLHLFCGRSFASSNGPDWLVCQDDIVPVVDFILDCVKLSLDDFNGFVLLSFGQSFSKAEDDFQAQIKTVLDFLRDNIISLTKMSSSFGVSQNNPLDINVKKVFGRNFSGISSIRVHGTVLSGNINILLFLGELDSD